MTQHLLGSLITDICKYKRETSMEHWYASKISKQNFKDENPISLLSLIKKGKMKFFQMDVKKHLGLLLLYFTLTKCHQLLKA